MNLRRVLQAPIGIIGLWGVILGAHGLYIYFADWRMFLWVASLSYESLFLRLRLPDEVSFLRDQVIWMTAEGFSSWFMPVLVGLVGLWLFYRFLLNEYVS